MRLLLVAAALAALLAWQRVPAAVQTSDTEKSEKKSYVGEIGGKTFEQWLKEIPSSDRSKGENAIRTIGLFPPDQAYVAVPFILGELGKHKPGYPIDLSIRVNGTIALGFLLTSVKEPDPKHVKEAVRLFTAALSDSQAILRYRSAQALGQLGSEARSAKDALQAAVGDPTSWEVREAAATALGRVARDPKDGPSAAVLAKLYYALEDKASHVRMAAVRSLAMLGPPSNPELKKALIKNLEKTGKDPDTRIVIWGQMAIMSLLNDFPEPRIQTIAKMLQHPEAATRIQAAQALGVLARETRSQNGTLPKALKAQVAPLMKAVKEALKERAPEAAGWYMLTLSQMGSSAAPAVPELREISSDKMLPEGLRKVAGDTIEMIQGKADGKADRAREK